MSFTQQRLVELLDEVGLRHWDSDEFGLIVPFSLQNPTRPSVSVHIRLDQDGVALSAMVTQFLRVPDDHPHIDQLMQALLHEAYVTALGQWELDPVDGEVRVTVQLPLFGAVPTARQVARVIGAAAQLAERAWPRFLSILEHGEDPVLDEQAPEAGEQARQLELRRLQLRMQELIASSIAKNPGGKNSN